MDQISMSPPGALPDIKAVLAAGDALATETPRHTGTVTSSERGIGAGTLGQAFRTRHTTKSQALLAAAAALPPVFQELGAGGVAAVRDYRETDAAGARGFRGGG
ncbi:hypothetical protein [Actinophytocola sp. KF-1]